MEENLKKEIEGTNQTGHIEQKENERKGFFFKTDLMERIMSIVILFVSYVYSMMLTTDGPEPTRVYLLIFAGLFYAFIEVMYFKRKRTFESWLFLGLSIMLILAYAFRFFTVWDEAAIVLFIHLFAVYYALVRSGRLSEGKTSHLFIWDGITGFFVMPFKNFPDLVLTIISIFKGNEDKEKRKNAVRVLIILLSVLIGSILLIIAVSNLMKADASYEKMLNQVLKLFKIEWDSVIIFRLILTVLISFYLYGLLGGCYRETEVQVMHRGDNIKKWIGMLKKVPNLVWMIFVGITSIFYLLFFGIQGTYMWGAFTGSLPSGFVYSSYAREGFFNMCMVMAINLTLDWLLSRTSEKDHPSILIGRSILGAESILFSIVAFLKLLMYIKAYGFTPLRLQSLWLIVVLLLGCILTLISAFTKKKTARLWFLISATLLVLLSFAFPNWREGMVIINGWYY